MTYSIELWQDGQKVIAVQSSRASDALSHMAVYAAVYERDGPLTIKVKHRKPKEAGDV